MTEQTHLLPVDLPFGRKTRARFARRPAERAVVFVHGFGGDAVKTWVDFPSLLPECAECAGHDLYFFDYDSLKQRAVYSASEFAAFLKAILTDPQSVFSANRSVTALRQAPIQYQRITIAAHSMGAVVSRRALLDLGRDAAVAPRLDVVRLVLYAPAHVGADVIGLASEALGVLKLALASIGAKFTLTILRDLEPQSLTLQALLQDTQAEYASRMQAAAPVDHLVAQAVIHGQDDKIVRQDQFFRDPSLTRAPGRGHTDLCKPSADYRDPLNHLLPHL